MRSSEFARRREEAFCGVRGELLNRESQVRNPVAGTKNEFRIVKPGSTPTIAYSQRIANGSEISRVKGRSEHSCGKPPLRSKRTG